MKLRDRGRTLEDALLIERPPALRPMRKTRRVLEMLDRLVPRERIDKEDRTR